MTGIDICRSKRTAIGNCGGSFALVRTDDMATLVMNAVLQGQEIKVDEVVFSCAN